MAFDEKRNYAQEINDLIAANGDPAKVQQLLNERLEKQQSMDTGYSTYDEVYRNAMDYLARRGYTPQVSANVDYAEIANQIMADQKKNGVENDMTHRSWADLGTVLDARENKLSTGAYDEWRDSTIGDSGTKYNGAGSLYEGLTGYANYTQDENERYRQMAAEILAGQTSAQPARTNVTDTENVGIAGGMSGGVVGATGRGARNLTDEQRWQLQQERAGVRDAIGELNAATRVPVNGEVSSYQQANTNKAFETAVQALLQGGDQAAASALQDAWDRYRANNLVNVMLPTGGAISIGSTGTGTTTTPVTNAGTATQTQTGAQEFYAEDPLYPGGTVQQTSPQSGLTDEQLAAVLAEMGVANVPVYGFTKTALPQGGLVSASAEPIKTESAAKSGGAAKSSGTSKNMTTEQVLPQNAAGLVKVDHSRQPITLQGDVLQTDAQFRMAYQQALAMGDRERMMEVLAAWNRWKQTVGGSLGAAEMQALGL